MKTFVAIIIICYSCDEVTNRAKFFSLLVFCILDIHSSCRHTFDRFRVRTGISCSLTWMDKYFERWREKQINKSIFKYLKCTVAAQQYHGLIDCLIDGWINKWMDSQIYKGGRRMCHFLKPLFKTHELSHVIFFLQKNALVLHLTLRYFK